MPSAESRNLHQDRVTTVARGTFLHSDDPPEVRSALWTLTAARLTANSGYRFAPPFLAIMASDLEVSLATLGAVLAISELAGLAGPAIGRLADRLDRRRALVIGLLGVAGSAALAGAGGHPVVLALALLALGCFKILFDVSLVGWLSDRVPYGRRARVIALTETSWALAMLMGVPVMGLVTAAASWRWGYATGAVAMVMLAAVIARRITPDEHHHDRRTSHRDDGPRRTPLTSAAWLLVISLGVMMAATQTVTVTFGSWLQDRHGFDAIALAAVVLTMGVAELGASLAVARFTDRWGKGRSVLWGTALMIPATLVLAMGGGVLPLGIAALLVFIASFEFAMVASISLATELVPGQPAAGFGIMIGAGTLGRVAASFVATLLYQQAGMWLPSLVAAAMAVITVGGIARYVRVTPLATARP
jgi:MFS transporter, DHA1 family, inner membrane transport protein